LKKLKHFPKIIFTNRLILIPFTTEICVEISNKNFEIIENMGLKNNKIWPDADMLETLPKIISNLSKVKAPTGFESWMIIKKENNEIIGDIGFKGLNKLNNSCDIGYGIIKTERRKGYAEESTKSLINWALKTDPSIKITASTLIDNESSIKLLQKLFFIEINRDQNFIYWKLEKNTLL
jgi:ribosomal-protein-alanine N-acetyltransferase